MTWPQRQKRIRIFAWASQFAAWERYNCEKCKKDYDDDKGKYPCDLQKILTAACMDDGTVGEEFAKRLGKPRDKEIWRCLEFEEK